MWIGTPPATETIDRARGIQLAGFAFAADPRRPAAMTRAAPTVGRSAAVPGNGVNRSSTNPDATMQARPAIPIGAARYRGTARPRQAASASPAPSASSQARAGSVKNAHGWAMPVSTIDRTSDTPKTTATTPASRPIVTRPPLVTRSRSAGQNR